MSPVTLLVHTCSEVWKSPRSSGLGPTSDSRLGCMAPPSSCVHILGAGSIGLLFAWHLRHAHVPVTLLASSAASAERMLAAGGGRLTLEYAGQRGEGSTCLPMWQQPDAHQETDCSPQAAASAAPRSYSIGIDVCRPLGGSPGTSGGRQGAAPGNPCSSGNPIGYAPTAASPASSPSPPETANITRLIVATKASDTVSALLSVSSRLSPSCQAGPDIATECLGFLLPPSSRLTQCCSPLVPAGLTATEWNHGGVPAGP